MAVTAELGRAPIFAFICNQALCNWQKIIRLDPHRILGSAHESELEIHNSGGNSWATFTATLLENIEHYDLWQNPDPIKIKKSSSPMTDKIRKKCSNLYFEHKFSSVGVHSKLR